MTASASARWLLVMSVTATVTPSVPRRREDRRGHERDPFDQLGLASVRTDRDLPDQGDPVEDPLDVDMAEVLGTEVARWPCCPRRQRSPAPNGSGRCTRAG